MGLINGAILESSNQNEVFRVIQIGLLCVQQYPEDRPSMSYVVLMLSSKVALPHPKKPGFFVERRLLKTDYSLSKPIVFIQPLISYDHHTTIVLFWCLWHLLLSKSCTWRNKSRTRFFITMESITPLRKSFEAEI